MSTVFKRIGRVNDPPILLFLRNQEDSVAETAPGFMFAVINRFQFLPGMSQVFGQGVILSCKPMGSDSMLEIAFEKAGTKKLMANYAKLEKK